MIRKFAALVLALASAAGALEAQKPRLTITLPDQSGLRSEPPVVRSTALVTDGTMLELIRNGFPARLHYRIERWNTGGWFDDIASSAEWDVVVRYDALTRRFEAYRVTGRQTVSLGNHETIDEADAAVGAPFAPPVAPPRSGRRGYYTLVLNIETLSLTELDEVERWLRGELEPAVRGKKNPGTALGRGVRTVMVRLLGGEKRRYEARTGTFRP